MTIIRDNYYDLLGVETNAGHSDIRQAFRKLAQKYHPDTGSIDAAHAELFKRITEAYHVLSDPDRRNDYNREAGLMFHEEINLGGTEETVKPPPAPEPGAEPRGKTSIEIGGSGKDFSHLKASVEGGDLKVGHKVALTSEEDLEKLKSQESEIAAWGELDSTSQKSGGFSLLSGLRRGNANMRRADLKKNLKSTLSEENQPRKPTGEFTKPKMPERTKPLPASDTDIENPLLGTRVFNFQITALDAALGTARELVLSVGNDGRPHKLEFEIPAGITDGTEMEVSRGWDRARVRIAVVQDPRFSVTGLDVRLRVPVTLKEALDGAEIVVPGVDQANRVKLRAAATSAEPAIIEQAGISADGDVGDLFVTPFIVPPLQQSATLTAAAKVVDEHCDADVRRDFLANPNSAKYRRDESNRVNMFVPILFGEALAGVSLNIPVDKASIKAEIPPLWDFTKEIAVADAAGLGERVLIVHPVIATPTRQSDLLQGASLAIEQHYLTPPRSVLPKFLKKRS